MKKLLLGALLVVGATSFGAVSDILDVSGNGQAALELVASGEILDTTDKPTLVVTPLGAGSAGNVLEFDFGDLALNVEETVSGQFEAKIVEYSNSAVNVLPTAADVITATLEGGTDIVTGEKIKVTLKDVDNVNKELGTLNYSLSFIPGAVDNDNKIESYTGTVLATVEPTAAGTFLSNAARVNVKVKGFSK